MRRRVARVDDYRAAAGFSPARSRRRTVGPAWPGSALRRSVRAGLDGSYPVMKKNGPRRARSWSAQGHTFAIRGDLLRQHDALRFLTRRAVFVAQSIYAALVRLSVWGPRHDQGVEG